MLNTEATPLRTNLNHDHEVHPLTQLRSNHECLLKIHPSSSSSSSSSSSHPERDLSPLHPLAHDNENKAEVDAHKVDDDDTNHPKHVDVPHPARVGLSWVPLPLSAGHVSVLGSKIAIEMWRVLLPLARAPFSVKYAWLLYQIADLVSPYENGYIYIYIYISIDR